MSVASSVPLGITYIPLKLLKPFAQNARTHSKHQIRQIAASIKEFGFTNPVLVDRYNTIIAGHGRVRAAELLGMMEVPTICLDQLTEHQIRAYVIADNKLAENAGWDKSILAIELQNLLTIEDFDVTITGFEVPEIDLILDEAAKESDKDDEIGLIRLHGSSWQASQARLANVKICTAKIFSGVRSRGLLLRKMQERRWQEMCRTADRTGRLRQRRSSHFSTSRQP